MSFLTGPDQTPKFAMFCLYTLSLARPAQAKIQMLTTSKGGFFSESAMCFLDLQISKKNIPKNYPELEI